MRRMVWVAVGAAGGIFVYKRAQQAVADARERGILVSAQQWGQSAASAVSAARDFARLPSPDQKQESSRGLRRDP